MSRRIRCVWETGWEDAPCYFLGMTHGAKTVVTKIIEREVDTIDETFDNATGAVNAWTQKRQRRIWVLDQHEEVFVDLAYAACTLEWEETPDDD